MSAAIITPSTELCHAFKSLGDYAALGLIPVGWSFIVLLYFNGIYIGFLWFMDNTWTSLKKGYTMVQAGMAPSENVLLRRTVEEEALALASSDLLMKIDTVSTYSTVSLRGSQSLALFCAVTSLVLTAITVISSQLNYDALDASALYRTAVGVRILGQLGLLLTGAMMTTVPLVKPSGMDSAADRPTMRQFNAIFTGYCEYDTVGFALVNFCHLGGIGLFVVGISFGAVLHLVHEPNAFNVVSVVLNSLTAIGFLVSMGMNLREQRQLHATLETQTRNDVTSDDTVANASSVDHHELTLVVTSMDRKCSVVGCKVVLFAGDHCLTSLTRRKSSVYVCIDHTMKNAGTDEETGFKDADDIFGWFRWSFLWEIIVVFTITVLDYVRSLSTFLTCTHLSLAPIVAFAVVLGFLGTVIVMGSFGRFTPLSAQERMKASTDAQFLSRKPDYQPHYAVVYPALLADGLRIQHAHEDLRQRPDVVLTAMNQNPEAIAFVHPSLFDDDVFLENASKLWFGWEFLYELGIAVRMRILRRQVKRIVARSPIESAEMLGGDFGNISVDTIRDLVALCGLLLLHDAEVAAMVVTACPPMKAFCSEPLAPSSSPSSSADIAAQMHWSESDLGARWIMHHFRLLNDDSHRTNDATDPLAVAAKPPPLAVPRRFTSLNKNVEHRGGREMHLALFDTVSALRLPAFRRIATTPPIVLRKLSCGNQSGAASTKTARGSFLHTPLMSFSPK